MRRCSCRRRGESLLIDSGNAGAGAARDAARIVAAAKDAGLTQIDHLITTHWHGDHFGGMAELAARIPIRHFIDHGAERAAGRRRRRVPEVRLSGAVREGHSTRSPNRATRLPLAGVDVLVVTSAGDTIKTPLPGAGAANPYCASFKPGENNAEDPMSVGVHVTFGRFRTMHLGDLTKNKEFELMCPTNRIGTIDVFLGLHHGVDTSNSDVIVHALRPRVAIMNNGTRKGGQPEVMKTLHSSPGLEDLWQIHFSRAERAGIHRAGDVHRQRARRAARRRCRSRRCRRHPPGRRAAGAGAQRRRATGSKCRRRQDGSFTVTNARNSFSKSYQAGRQ